MLFLYETKILRKSIDLKHEVNSSIVRMTQIHEI